MKKMCKIPRVSSSRGGMMGIMVAVAVVVLVAGTVVVEK